MAKVFIIPFHVRRMDESVMPPDISSAYVSCYCLGEDYVEAAKKVLEKLSEDGLYAAEILQPVHEMNLENWSRHVAEMWPAHASSLLTQAEFEKVMKTGGVAYGPFASYA